LGPYDSMAPPRDCKKFGNPCTNCTTLFSDNLAVFANGDSSNYTINSIWLSEQQAAEMCNFGRKHQRYLAAVQYKIREGYLG